MQTFPQLFVLYVYHGEFLVGTYYHPNAAACRAKQEELEAQKQGWAFKVVEYAEVQPQ